MQKQVHFYFDFMSPYSYLANTQLPTLVDQYDAHLVYHVMDIPSAKLAAGNFGPSNREVGPKFSVLVEDLKRWAQHYQVPFTFPPNLDCSRWNIGALYEGECSKEYVDIGFDSIWGKGIDPMDDEPLINCANQMGWEPQAFLDFTSGSEGATKFRQQCVYAHDAGVFGAPIMIVDDEIFWGNDRLIFLERSLNK